MKNGPQHTAGQAVELPFPAPPSARELFGFAVHHVLWAHFCLERGRLWQAAYWINSTRDYALNLVCLRRGLPAVQGCSVDLLPAEMLARFENTLIASLKREALLRALAGVIAGLLAEVDDVGSLAEQVAPQLLVLAEPWQP